MVVDPCTSPVMLCEYPVVQGVSQAHLEVKMLRFSESPMFVLCDTKQVTDVRASRKLKNVAK
jgi:hypothetical protein